MIETYLNLTVNRKTDIELIQGLLREHEIKAPIVIVEFEDRYEINFTSEYEQWELESEILKAFPEYEFTQSLGKGRKEIRLEFSRQQSSLSSDNWGRPLENPIDETKYLVKRTQQKIIKFSPQVKVLLGDTDEFYYINIIGGVDKVNNRTGYLVLNDFREFDKDKEAGFLKNELHETPMEAFRAGVRQINYLAESDYEEYLKVKKRNKRKKKK
ncbi:hypothetical protein PY092_10345 [Muricauda sp. 334s03]|uniref:CYTH domain-containing protein n=1 Tax=Flagellimonas yonaguniensis TaxID=3031325 RepID=A0ABT5XZM4_9FLAO|nr:hypothetical protein [[Muricauda] yonaguniensis]MDF0716548.1 hypothetical protein [[Muricauda] yonaguniensis]